MAKITLFKFLDNFEAKIFNKHLGAVKFQYFQNIQNLRLNLKFWNILNIFSKKFICSQILDLSDYNPRYYAWTRLGIHCQTPALSKVYFTWVETIILGLKKFGSKNLKLKNILIQKKFLIQKRKQSQLLDYLTCEGKKFGTTKILSLKKFSVPKKILVPKNLLFPKKF